MLGQINAAILFAVHTHACGNAANELKRSACKRTLTDRAKERQPAETPTSTTRGLARDSDMRNIAELLSVLLYSSRGADMPKYYFHIRKGEVFEEASEPIEVNLPEDVEEEAIEAARDLLAEGDLAGLDRREWAFEVADEDGETVFNLSFADAIEPDLPAPDNTE